MKLCTVPMTAVIAAVAASSVHAADNAACALLSPAEIDAALGVKADLKGSIVNGVEVCSAQAGSRYVMVRLVKKTAAEGAAGNEQQAAARIQQAVDAARKRGADVETKKDGPVFCMSIVSHAAGNNGGYDTSCTYSKPPHYAVVEVVTSSQKDRVPMDTLQQLAAKMAGRF